MLDSVGVVSNYNVRLIWGSYCLSLLTCIRPCVRVGRCCAQLTLRVVWNVVSFFPLPSSLPCLRKSFLVGLNGTRFNHVFFPFSFFFASRLVSAVVVFGFMFYITDLPGNFYLNMAAMYIGDVPGVLIIWITVQK